MASRGNKEREHCGIPCEERRAIASLQNGFSQNSILDRKCWPWESLEKIDWVKNEKPLLPHILTHLCFVANQLWASFPLLYITYIINQS